MAGTGLMLLRLLLAFTLVPLVELLLLLYVSHTWLGLPGTLALVLATGTAGALLARHQGTRAWREIQQALAAGRMPADELLSGAATLAGGLLLLTPGILTDACGFLLLLPPTRAVVVGWIKRRFKGRVQFVRAGQGERIVDAEEVRISDAPGRVPKNGR